MTRQPVQPKQYGHATACGRGISRILTNATNPTAVLGLCPPSLPRPSTPTYAGWCAVGKSRSKTVCCLARPACGLRCCRRTLCRHKAPIGDLAPRGLLLGCFCGGLRKVWSRGMYVRWPRVRREGCRRLPGCPSHNEPQTMSVSRNILDKMGQCRGRRVSVLQAVVCLCVFVRVCKSWEAGSIRTRGRGRKSQG